MVNPRILYTKPSITELEVQYATEATRDGWGDRCYEYLHRFEERFRLHLGTRFAIATASCTGALHMGLAAVGIGPGDDQDVTCSSRSRNTRAGVSSVHAHNSRTPCDPRHVLYIRIQGPTR